MLCKMKRNIHVKLFIFDLDGTALGGHEPYERFPDIFVKFLDSLDFYGIRWATNTTWAIEKQLELIRSSGVKSDPVLLTGATGRVAATIKGNQIVHLADYENHFTMLDQQFREKHGKLIREILAKALNSGQLHRLAFNEHEHNIISYTVSKEQANKFRRSISPLLQNDIYYIFDPFANSSSTMLLPAYMNKGTSVRIIQQESGITPANTLVAGDAPNDFHMFDSNLAQYMICPNNAHPELKKIVLFNNGIVASQNYSFGLIEAMSEHLNKTKNRRPKI